jgi:phage gpG-like protein
MTKHLGSLMAMAEEFALLAPTIALELHHGLKRVAVLVERTAKAEFGVYQNETGPFPGWPELADSTKDDRVAKGFSENEPLLRTGELRDSIEHQVSGLEAVIGSTDERMAWQEFGTDRLPARPVLGPAAFRNKEAIEKLVGAALATGLVGGEKIHEALGYDFETSD